MSAKNRRFIQCPRCGEYAYELLDTHEYCINCNYSPEDEFDYYDEIPYEALECICEDDFDERIEENQKEPTNNINTKEVA